MFPLPGPVSEAAGQRVGGRWATVGTTHLLAALLDRTGTNAETAAEIERVLAESGADIAGLQAEPAVPRGTRALYSAGGSGQ